MHISLSLESLWLLKNFLDGFKDLSIHKDRQRETTLYYSMLLRAGNDVIAIFFSGILALKLIRQWAA
jgi:hypothetical protein